MPTDLDPKERAARLKRLAAVLQRKGLDPSAAVQAIPTLKEMALSPIDVPDSAKPEMGRQLVDLRRWTDRTTPIGDRPLEGPLRSHRGPINGPLPDRAWDRLFGALQVAEIDAAAQGKKFGFRPGEMGQDAIQDYSPQGVTYNALEGHARRFEPTAPGHTAPRARVMDPYDRAMARTIGQEQRRRRY